MGNNAANDNPDGKTHVDWYVMGVFAFFAVFWGGVSLAIWHYF